MMEWADIARLYRYWRDAPPVHELVAGAVGLKPAPSVRGSETDRTVRPSLELSAEEILRGFNSGTQTPIGVR